MGAALPARRLRQATLGKAPCVAGCLDEVRGRRDRRLVMLQLSDGVTELMLGFSESSLEIGSQPDARVRFGQRVLQLSSEVCLEVIKPHRDRAARRAPSDRSRGWSAGGGEGAALGGGGDVDPVTGEDVFEEVAGVVEIGGLGDDEDQVLFAAACRADVEPPVSS